MSYCNKTLNEMLDEIKFTNFGRFDYIIPESKEHIIIESQEVITNQYFDDIMAELMPYIENHIGPAIKKGHTKESIIFDIISPVIYAIENAFTRGNKYAFDRRRRTEGYLPFSIKTFHGGGGIIFRIRDSGNGFNHRKRINDSLNCRGILHGMEVIAHNDYVQASYENRGNTINIMIKS